MKRSKIFLGITACALAIVAFASAKSAKYFGRTVKAYYSVSNGKCTLFGNAQFFTKVAPGSGSLQGKVLRQGNEVLVYSYSASACVHPIYTINN
jgi:hypothetical protein